MNSSLIDVLQIDCVRSYFETKRHEPTPEPAVQSRGGARRLPDHFNGRSLSDFTDETFASSRVSQVYEFEGLLVRILARFVNLATEELDHEIGRALGGVCSFLGLQRAGFWRASATDQDSFQLTHQWVAQTQSAMLELLPDGPLADSDLTGQNPIQRIPVGTAFAASFPWIAEQTKRGKITQFSTLDELPVEAGQDKESFRRFGTCSNVVVPLIVRNKALGAVSFDMLSNERVWPQILVQRLELIAEILADVTARAVIEEAAKTAMQQVAELGAALDAKEAALTKSHSEIKQLKDRLQVEAEFLKSEIKVSQTHCQVIGRSKGIKEVLHQVEQVAPADCSVLINGETGTGKELIAQEIHQLSSRKDRLMVLVNCAALPSALVESELFGRERGAYTGALTSQVGRFEVANGSTIFLDEVGELSMEVQAKLLRVLQEGEFQRLGSPKTHKVNVRVIAATNKDLAAEVRKGRFREDLYYRLRVFPIEIPPLRQRIEDIPSLVFAFLDEFATRMGKKITKVPRSAMEALQKHSWPGNIRELRNVIEHSVILTSGDTLKLSFLGEAPTRDVELVTLAEAEREHILRTLERTSWRIKGPHGAAQRLALQPSTLYSRMQKLGIPHRRQKDQIPAET